MATRVCFPNGLLDLSTRRFVSPLPEPVGETAQCFELPWTGDQAAPTFIKLLRDQLDDPVEVRRLCAMLGRALLGGSAPDRWPVRAVYVHGETAGGKTTLLRTLTDGGFLPDGAVGWMDGRGRFEDDEFEMLACHDLSVSPAVVVARTVAPAVLLGRAAPWGRDATVAAFHFAKRPVAPDAGLSALLAGEAPNILCALLTAYCELLAEVGPDGSA